MLTFTAPWLMTGSAVLPVRDLLMNLLTLAAATDVVVFVFQEGNLAGLFGSSARGRIEQTDCLMMAVIVFGLSTGCGVFVLTRIKEARDHGTSDEQAITAGLKRSGGALSAAAVLLAITVGAFRSRLPQGARPRGRRGTAGRLHRPGAAGAIPDGAARLRQLVVAAAAAPDPREGRPGARGGEGALESCLG